MSDYLKVHEWGSPSREILIKKKSVDVVRHSNENQGAVLTINGMRINIIETYDFVKEKLDKEKRNLNHGVDQK